MWRLALGALAVLSVVAAPSALAGWPGKRFAHNRGDWLGEQPIEVVGSVNHPSAITVRVRWRTLKQQPPAPPPEPLPDDSGFRVAATAIPGEGVVVNWRMICPLGSVRAIRRNGAFTSTSSPDLHALPLPRRGLPRCQVLADAKGPGGVIGKIMLDLYAR